MSDGRRCVAVGLIALALAVTGCEQLRQIQLTGRDAGSCDLPAWRQAQAVAYREGAGAEVLDLLRTVIAACPEEVEAHQRYIELAGRLGGADEAAMRAFYQSWQAPRDSAVSPFVRGLLETSNATREEWFERALSRDSGLAAAHREIGVAWQRERRLERALPFLERAVELDDTDPRTNLALARLLVDLRRGKRAARLFGRYLAARPDDREVGREFVRLAIYTNRDAAAARPVLESLREDAPDDVELWMDAAAAAWLAGERADAADLYRQVLQRQPRNTRAVLNFGNLYFVGPNRGDAARRRDWELARTAYRCYLAMEPDPAEHRLFGPLRRDVSVPERLRVIDALLGAPSDERVPQVSDLL